MGFFEGLFSLLIWYDKVITIHIEVYFETAWMRSITWNCRWQVYVLRNKDDSTFFWLEPATSERFRKWSSQQEVCWTMYPFSSFQRPRDISCWFSLKAHTVKLREHSELDNSPCLRWSLTFQPWWTWQTGFLDDGRFSRFRFFKHIAFPKCYD